MKKRYAIYSTDLGVYLGPSGDGSIDGTAWSKSNPCLYSSAPTFLPGENVRDEEETGSLATVLESLSASLGGALLKAIEVWPDLPANRASIDACANAQLPRWNPDNK